MDSKHTFKGFTLLELLVVIAIIGLLASVVIASLSSAREKGRNSARIQQISQYIKAFDLSFSTYGSYPNDGVDAEQHCLGTYPDGNCNGASNPTDVSTMDARVRTPYISAWPPIAEVSNEGLRYITNGTTGQDYYLYYRLEGDTSCTYTAGSPTPCSSCILGKASLAVTASSSANSFRCYWSPLW